MFGLFYSLIVSMIYGTWYSFDTSTALEHLQGAVTVIWNNAATLFRNIGLKLPDSFTLSDAESFIGTLDQNVYENAERLGLFLPRAIAAIIALVVTIGIIMVTVKAIKSIFRVFLGGRLR